MNKKCAQNASRREGRNLRVRRKRWAGKRPRRAAGPGHPPDGRPVNGRLPRAKTRSLRRFERSADTPQKEGEGSHDTSVKKGGRGRGPTMITCAPGSRHSRRRRRSMENVEKDHGVKPRTHKGVLPVEWALDQPDEVSVPWSKDPAPLAIGRAALPKPTKAPARNARTKQIVASVADPIAAAGAI
jgi:hypothetical protein